MLTAYQHACKVAEALTALDTATDQVRRAHRALTDAGEDASALTPVLAALDSATVQP